MSHYHIYANDKTFGPYELPKMQQYVVSGKIKPTTLISVNGADWVQAAYIPELAPPAQPVQPAPRVVAPPQAVQPPMQAPAQVQPQAQPQRRAQPQQAQPQAQAPVAQPQAQAQPKRAKPQPQPQAQAPVQQAAPVEAAPAQAEDVAQEEEAPKIKAKPKGPAAMKKAKLPGGKGPKAAKLPGGKLLGKKLPGAKLPDKARDEDADGGGSDDAVAEDQAAPAIASKPKPSPKPRAAGRPAARASAPGGRAMPGVQASIEGAGMPKGLLLGSTLASASAWMLALALFTVWQTVPFGDAEISLSGLGFIADMTGKEADELKGLAATFAPIQFLHYVLPLVGLFAVVMEAMALKKGKASPISRIAVALFALVSVVLIIVPLMQATDEFNEGLELGGVLAKKIFGVDGPVGVTHFMGQGVYLLGLAFILSLASSFMRPKRAKAEGGYEDMAYAGVAGGYNEDAGVDEDVVDDVMQHADDLSVGGDTALDEEPVRERSADDTHVDDTDLNAGLMDDE